MKGGKTISYAGKKKYKAVTVKGGTCQNYLTIF